MNVWNIWHVNHGNESKMFKLFNNLQGSFSHRDFINMKISVKQLWITCGFVKVILFYFICIWYNKLFSLMQELWEIHYIVSDLFFFRWYTSPDVVNAYYNPQTNSISKFLLCLYTYFITTNNSAHHQNSSNLGTVPWAIFLCWHMLSYPRKWFSGN